MKQVPNYADTRQLARCVYCAASAKNTLDHVPSKVLIDKPFPEGEGSSIYITDPDGNELPLGEVGEIWFWGPNLIRGYWNRPEDTAETIVDGWLRSGDIGHIDDEGFVYVVDRVKDMVLRGGENIYCAEVEAAIYENAAVYEAAVFGLPHERLGEELACAIYVKPGAKLDAEALKADLAQRVAAFKVPSRIEFYREQLPRNAAGKILKRDLRDALLDGRAT